MSLETIEKTNWKSLDFISSKYPLISIDTCSLGAPIIHQRVPKYSSIEKKIESLDEDYNSVLFFEESFYKNNLYITPLILKEYLNFPSWPSKSEIKKTSHLSKGLLSFKRKMRKLHQKKRSLTNLFQDKDRIIYLDENEGALYNDFKKKYSKSKKDFDISETDFDFLISGAVLSQKRDACALISNDCKILSFWRYFLRQEDIPSETLGFFIRKTFLEFGEISG